MDRPLHLWGSLQSHTWRIPSCHPIHPDEGVYLRLFAKERDCCMMCRCYWHFFHYFSLWIYDEHISSRMVVVQSQDEHRSTARGNVFVWLGRWQEKRKPQWGKDRFRKERTIVINKWSIDSELVVSPKLPLLLFFIICSASMAIPSGWRRFIVAMASIL